MNERLKQIAIDAKLIAPEYNGFDHTRLSISQQRFAELIVQECINIMKTEWYELNNMPVDTEGESPRDVGIRVGRKTEVIALMSKVNKHFGVKQ